MLREICFSGEEKLKEMIEFDKSIISPSNIANQKLSTIKNSVTKEKVDINRVSTINTTRRISAVGRYIYLSFFILLCFVMV